jgi:uncharacterized protein (DUF2336 family)
VTQAASSLAGEIDAALRTCSPTRNNEILSQLTDLFLANRGRLGESQVSVFDDVLKRLAMVSDISALSALSMKLADVDNAPRATVLQLAHRVEIAIAGPVLAGSARLSEPDLIEIAKIRGQHHLLAICQRSTLDRALTDVLIKRRLAVVSLAVVRNTGARFSKTGYAILIENAERDDDLADSLGSRSDNPAEVLQRLSTRATRTVRKRLMTMAPINVGEKIEAVLANAAALTGQPKAAPIDFSEAEAIVLSLNRAGKLVDTTVNRFALDGQFDKVGAALALLASVEVKAIGPLLTSTRPDGLIVACRASRLSWSTTGMILRNRVSGSTPSQQLLATGKTAFDTLSVSAAQRAIRFWEFRCLGKKAGTGNPEPQPDNVEISEDQELVLV